MKAVRRLSCATVFFTSLFWIFAGGFFRGGPVLAPAGLMIVSQGYGWGQGQRGSRFRGDGGAGGPGVTAGGIAGRKGYRGAGRWRAGAGFRRVARLPPRLAWRRMFRFRMYQVLTTPVKSFYGIA